LETGDRAIVIGEGSVAHADHHANSPAVGGFNGMVVGPTAGGSGVFAVNAIDGNMTVGVFGASAANIEIAGANGQITTDAPVTINYRTDFANNPDNLAALSVSVAGGGANSKAAEFIHSAGGGGVDASTSINPVVSIRQEIANREGLQVNNENDGTIYGAATFTNTGANNTATTVTIENQSVQNGAAALRVVNGSTQLAYANIAAQADLQNATATVIDWTGGANILVNWLPLNAQDGQILWIRVQDTETITDADAAVFTGSNAFGRVASLVYFAGGWHLVRSQN
jgi:hypothetical protein